MGERGKTQNAHAKAIEVIKRFSKKLWNLSSYLMPDGITCIDCGRELGSKSNTRYSMCEECLKKLPYRTGHYCLRCGQRLAEGTLCKDCELADPPYEKLFAPFEYDGFPRKIIIRQKDAGATYLYKYSARFIADIYKGFGVEADGICYVPTSTPAVKKRGSDHTKRIAEILSEEVHIPVYHALVRVTENGDQTEFSRAERFENVKHAFALSGTGAALPPKGSRVVLVDDVVTTGATVSECTTVLKKYGVSEVYVLSLARR